MFNGCSALKTIYVSSAWTTYAVTDGNDMFAGCTSLVGGAGTSYDASHVDYTYAHIDGGTSNPGYFTNVKEKPQPYAVLSENNTKLTFYYDDQREARGGMSVGPFYDSDDVTWYNQKNSITSAEFDPSFANCTTIYSTAYWFSGCWNMVSISGIQYLKTDNVTDMNDMFWGCSGLKSLDLSAFNTANVTNMNDMFGGCSGLKSLDLSAFNTANVTDMSYMFFSCMGLKTIDVSNFNTASVTIMEGMFAECTSLRRIYAKENWDFTNLKEERYMFRGCVDIVGGAGTRYNEYYVDNRYAHIDEGRSNPGYFTDKEAPIDMTLVPYAALGKNSTELTFYYNKDKDIEGGFSIEASDKYPEWLGYSDITTVIFDDSFAQCSTITSTAHWFSDCKKLTTIIGIDNLKTDNVADMSTMFAGCSALTSLDLSNFNTTNVTDMSGMFYDSALTSLDLSNFNTTNVTNMSGMFMFCSNLKTIYPGENWSTEKVTNSQNMFGGCYYLEGSAGTLYNGNYIDVTYAHIDEGRSNPGYFSDKNAPAYTLPYALLSNDSTKLTFYYDNQKVTKGGMGVGTFTDLSNNNINSGWNEYKRSITTIEFDSSFADCNTLTSTACWFRAFTNLTSIIGIENLNTSNVTDMNYMFNGCENLKELDLSSFNTDNVTDLSRMFQKCRALTSLDLSQFNTSNVVNMDNMFDKCSSLTTIYAGNAWTTKKVTSGKEMFYNCTSLVGGAGTKFDATHISYAYAHIDGGASNPGYFTDKNAAPVATVEPYAVLSDNNTVLTFYYDDQKEVRGGMSVGPFYMNDSGTIEGRQWNDAAGSITTVVFDNSFVNCTSLTSTYGWFYGCKNLITITDIGNLKTDNVADMSYMFSDCSSLKALNVSGFKTDKVVNIWFMFSGCSSLTSLDVSGFNMGNVWGMNGMFSGCSGLTSIDLGNFNTENVRYMTGMFGECSGLTSLDVSGFNTTNVIDMNSMFRGCSSLTSLDLGKFNTLNVTDLSFMFWRCNNLLDLDISSFNTANAKMVRIFEECSSLASIRAGNANIPAEEYTQVNNPNLLVYVNDASLAPSNVQNVVINGIAREIVLTDVTDGNNDWYAPQAFVAERISYTRNFTQSTTKGTSRGWESIALPFRVQTIQHETKGVIAPFNNPASSRHFWLRRLTENGLQPVTGIEANIPYIISMPNSEEYTDDYNLNGRVTFSAQNAQVPATVTNTLALADSSIVMVPAMQRKERSSAVWALNVGEVRGSYFEGSVFERDYREVRPFEAYTVHRLENSQPAPRYIPLMEIGGTTGIDASLVNREEVNNEEWYDLEGRKLQGQPKQKGVYISKGKKVVVK